MKKILSRGLLFMLPILIMVIILFLRPYNRKFAYLSKNNMDCNTSWIYHRLYENKNKVDIAFLGTSHTGCGVNDIEIENRIDSLTNGNLKVANLAYCGGGRNMDYVLLKDLLDEKSPHTVIVELKNENNLIHQDYGIMASAKDLWMPPAVPSNYFSNLYTGLKCRWDQFREQLIFGSKIELDISRDTAGVMNMKDEDKSKLPYQKKKKVILTINQRDDHSFSTVFRNKMTDEDMTEHLKHKEKLTLDDINCIKAMKEIADKKKVKFFFLYLPSFENYYPERLMASAYSKYGVILFPPEELFKTKDYWIDHEHLNSAGAAVLSNWLSGQQSQLMAN